MDYGKEFFEIMEKIHKLSYKARLKGKLPQGEFMMLIRIECFIEKQKEMNNSIQGVKVSELSNILKASKPATSKMLSNLEEKNFIERIMDKKDRRVVYVRLTEEGIKTLEESKNKYKAFTNHIFERLGKEDADHLIRIFNKLSQIIIEEITK